MPRANKDKKVKHVIFDLRDCIVSEKQVRHFSDTSSQLYLPKEWEGKTVYVVLKNE